MGQPQPPWMDRPRSHYGKCCCLQEILTPRALWGQVSSCMFLIIKALLLLKQVS